MKSNSIKYIWQMPDYMSQEALKGNGVSIHVQPVQKFYLPWWHRLNGIWIGRKKIKKERARKIIIMLLWQHILDTTISTGRSIVQWRLYPSPDHAASKSICHDIRARIIT